MLPAGTENAQRGYTLVELLVVLAVGVLLLSALPAAYGSAFPSVKLKAGAQDIASLLKAVKTDAIASQRARTLEIVDGEIRSKGGAPKALFEAEIGQRIWFQPFRPSSGAASQVGITFYEDGTATGGTIHLVSASRRYRIDVDWLTGNIEVTQ